MQRLGGRHAYYQHKKEKPRNSEEDIVDDHPDGKRSAPYRPHSFRHILGDCFRRPRAYVEPIEQEKPLPSMFARSTHNDHDKPKRNLNDTYSPLPHQLDPAYSDFVYDVLVLTRRNKNLRRRLLLDFQTDVDVISEELYHDLRTKRSYCDPSTPLKVASLGEVRPLGTVDVRWSLWNDTKVFRATFFVVKGCQFDMLLGRPSIKKNGLSSKDAAVKPRIQASYRQP